MNSVNYPERVLTVSVNPAVDKTYWLESLKPGSVNRVLRVSRKPGGKANNVLRILHELEVDAIGTGFIGGENGKWIADQLNSLGIKHDFYWISGETRSTINIMESCTKNSTELLEPGPVVSLEDVDKFYRHIERLLPKIGLMALSGSLLPGLPLDFYAQLIDRASFFGVKVFLDTSGEVLRQSLPAHPYMVKINQCEFEQWLGVSYSLTPLDIVKELERLRAAGPSIAVVTLEEKGCYVCSAEGVWHVSSVPVELVNAVGSGDAFLAGLMSAIAKDYSFTEALSLGVAVGASNAAHENVGEIDLEQVIKLQKMVMIQRLR